MNQPIQINAGSLSLAIDQGGLSISDPSTGQPLLFSSGGWPLLPVVDGQPVAGTPAGADRCGEGFRLLLETAPSSPVGELALFCEAAGEGGAIDLRCEFRARRRCELNALAILPPGSGMNLYDVVNFRNRHFTEKTWPELLIGRELETGTYSDDWQFAPHPTALILRKNEVSLFAGFTELQASFGMRLKVRQSVVRHWEVDFGAAPHGLKLEPGEVFRSAPLRIFLRRGNDPCLVFSEFGAMLAREGKIADPAAKPRFDWWREPIYCTWGDQWMLANKQPAVDLRDQTSGEAAPAVEMLDEAMVRRAVAVIEQERLPVRTVILDDGWSAARGDWRPHPRRFPDLRGLVDDLHRAGFRVLVWWNWAEIAAEAEADPQYLAGGGWLNKHGARWRDYSDPATQEGYLKPLFRTLFSSEPGCLDLDGVKTDFLADKVHPETVLADPSWRGEERYFRKVTELFYGEMRKYKADALHLGCAGNFWLAELIDLNRTYDVHSSNWLEHEERARMLACTSPGATVSYDMMTCSENTGRWFDSARRLGAGVELGNVLSVRDNLFSTVRPAGENDWKQLRENLS